MKSPSRIVRSRHLPVLLISILLGLALAPASPGLAQQSREFTVQAFQCPVGYTGSHAGQHCFDVAPDEDFKLVTGGGTLNATTDRSGVAAFDLSGEVSQIRLSGPVFFWSTTSDHPRPVVQAVCLDETGNEIETTGGNPGSEISIESLPNGDITCNWYIGADNGNHSAWQGGYPDLVPGIYPGEFVAIYGAQSEYPAASLTFELDSVPDHDMTLDITGIDDELPAKVKLQASLNGETIFEGPSEFPDWVEGMEEPGHMVFTLPAGTLQQGHNVFTLSNLAPDANFGEPPWVLVGASDLH